MLNKIETQEIITKKNAKVKYRTQYIVMIITEVVDQGDNEFKPLFSFMPGQQINEVNAEQ